MLERHIWLIDYLLEGYIGPLTILTSFVCVVTAENNECVFSLRVKEISVRYMAL